MVMGHSLANGPRLWVPAWSPSAEALVAVSARARAMASVSIGDKGKMASVMGPTDEIGAFCPRWRLPHAGQHQQPQADRDRGCSDAVDRAVDYFNKLGMIAQLIPVSHAFHSKVVAPRRMRCIAPSCEMQIRIPAHSAGGQHRTANSTRPTTWTPSAPPGCTKWRPRSSSFKGHRDLLPGGGAAFFR